MSGLCHGSVVGKMCSTDQITFCFKNTIILFYVNVYLPVLLLICGPNSSHPDMVSGDMPRYYAWDYRVLKTFARHYSTGEVIPQKLVESMESARKMFAATELQRQVNTVQGPK